MYSFVYNSNKIKLDAHVSVDKTSYFSIDQILDQVQSQTGINYEIKRDQVVLIPPKFPRKNIKAYGSLSGKIEDNKKKALPYASILIEELNIGTTTDNNGNFKLSNLPTGKYTLMVYFLGYKSKSKEITVYKKQTTKVQIVLSEEQTNLVETVVYGYISRGQAFALNQQKNAGNIQNIVSSEQFSKFPDRNAAEVLSRIPSVSVDYDQGEGQNVLIRGLSSDYNSLTINGERIPSPDPKNGSRGVGLDLLNQNLIESIEVIKAITPDMDGDAIGGTVNFKMKEATDSINLSADIGIGYNPQYSEFETYGKDIMNFSVFGGNRFFNNKLGVLLGGCYYKTNLGSMMREYDYEDDDNISNEKIYAQHTNDYDVKRQRFGFISNLDYKFNDFNKLNINVNSNYYFDDEIRRSARYNITDCEETRETRNRREDQRLYNIVLRGENQISKIKIDYFLNLIRASEDMPGRTYWRYARTINYDLYTNDDVKNFSANTILESKNILTLNRLRCDNFYKRDKDLTAKVNITIPFNIKNFNNSLKFGAKYLKKNVKYHPFRIDYEEFADPYTIEAGQFGMENLRFTDINIDDLNASVINEVQSVKRDSYTATEEVAAGYGMFICRFNRKFSLLGGLRLENTQNKYRSLYSEDDNKDTNKVTSNYINILPSAHFTYKPTDKINLRLAYSSGMARPTYFDLIPVEFEDNEDESKIEFTEGNPDLKATTSNNVDFMFERYTNYLGFMSAGIFYKYLSNVISDKTYTSTSDGIITEITKPMNRDKATVYGAEFAFNQRLNFVSVPFFYNLTIYGNYTYTRSMYKVDGREIVLCGSPKNVFNLALMYDNPKKGWSFVLSNVYRDAILYTEGDNKYTDQYYGGEYHLDMSINKKITKKVNILVQLNNLTDQYEVEYLGDPTKIYSRELQWEKYNISGIVTFQYKL